jgi:hypothetical protein
MLRKLTIALAATVSLSAALAPSIASAKGMGGFGGHHHFGHFGGFGIAGAIAAGVVAADVAAATVVDESCFVRQRVVTPYGYRMRTINVCEQD